MCLEGAAVLRLVWLAGLPSPDTELLHHCRGYRQANPSARRRPFSSSCGGGRVRVRARSVTVRRAQEWEPSSSSS